MSDSHEKLGSRKRFGKVKINEKTFQLQVEGQLHSVYQELPNYRKSLFIVSRYRCSWAFPKKQTGKNKPKIKNTGQIGENQQGFRPQWSIELHTQRT